MSVTAETAEKRRLSRPLRTAATVLAVVAFLFVVYLAVGGPVLGPDTQRPAEGSIYAMIALGYTMVYGVLQLINFAHSEIFLIGTVVALFAIRNWFGVTEPQTGIALILVLLGVADPRDARSLASPRFCSSGSPTDPCVSVALRGWPS